jgi:hypothetical protein
MITVVSGLPRSGTSLMMRMLEAGGLPPLSDSIREADIDNPNGYYEFEPVKQIAKDVSRLQDAEEKAVKIISSLLRDLPSSRHYKVIFMERKIEEVLASQRDMMRHRGTTAESPRRREPAAIVRSTHRGNARVAAAPAVHECAALRV